MTDIEWERELAHIVLVRDLPVDEPTLFHLRNSLVVFPSEGSFGSLQPDETVPPLSVRRAG